MNSLVNRNSLNIWCTLAERASEHTQGVVGKFDSEKRAKRVDEHGERVRENKTWRAKKKLAHYRNDM